VRSIPSAHICHDLNIPARVSLLPVYASRYIFFSFCPLEAKKTVPLAVA
jgi:hypothetical protein